MIKIIDANRYTNKESWIFRILSIVAITVFLACTALVFIDSTLGLKVIWYLIIPLAPMIFFLVPNVWTSLCPLAITQSLPKRLGLNWGHYLNKRQTKWLNNLGIMLLLLLVPARIFIFNDNGEISFYTMILLALFALISGIIFSGLSGWCMGLCPIRPVELMYGRFTVEKNRPEVCNTCDLCVNDCSRLHIDDKDKLEKNYYEYAWFIYLFPGFIFSYYLVNSQYLIYYIYLTIAIYSFISWVFFKLIERFFKQAETIYFAIILCMILYYMSSIPGIAIAWQINARFQPLLYVLPFSVILYGIYNGLPSTSKNRVLISLASVLFVYFTVYGYSKGDSYDINHTNWQDYATKTGNESCLSCHESIVKSYAEAEMGTSYSPMSELHIDLPIDSSHVYDPKSDFHYDIVKRDKNYYMRERRFNESNQLVHDLEFKIDHVIGSGANTKSFINIQNGYYYEMPITWYSNKRKWDLSPGYHNYNIRFFRETNQKCINCHTQETNFETHSVNKFKKVDFGIDCEKCHGPASLHISDMKGITDYPFRTIINPAKDQDQTDMVCYDCHGKSEVHQLEEAEDMSIRFTAHATRLSLSRCFTESDLTCITCHDPHYKLEKTTDRFNKACLSCHESTVETMPNHKNDFDCVSCHMPKKDSRDIPHLSPTEHWIKVYDKTSPKYYEGIHTDYRDYIKPESQFEWEKNQAKLFLQKYRESIGSNKVKEDTLFLAYQLMSKQIILTANEKLTYGIILYYSKKYDEALELFEDLRRTDAVYFKPNPDYFLHFAKTYIEQKNFAEAERLLEMSLKIYPNHIPSLLQISILYYYIGKHQHAITYADNILGLTGLERDALYHKAFVYHQGLKDIEAATQSYIQLLKLFPDDHDASINLAAIYYDQKNFKETRRLLENGAKQHPYSQIMLANASRFMIESGDIELADKYMKQLKELNPSSPFLRALQQMRN